MQIKQKGGRWSQRVTRCALSVAATFTAAIVQAQMFVPGQFTVSPSGAATYAIPIAVPPGVGGMEPKLALVYNSQAGNSSLGVGWSLSGLSSITRCPKTVAQDGVRGSVNFDTNDRYCLDGQRLIATVNGTDGANGAEYRSEQDAYSKVTSYSETGATNGPGSFIAKTKSGLTMEYGKTAVSRIEAQGRTVVGVWALNKVTDAKGNSYSVTYSEDNANGQFYPIRIDYTSSVAVTSGQGISSVILDYELRQDIVPMYNAGSLFRQTMRLAFVRVLDGRGNLIYKYQPSYEKDALTGRSQITSITKSSSLTLPSVRFGRAPAPTPTLNVSRFETQTGAYSDNQKWLVADMNGDGLVDFINIFGANGQATVDVHVNTGSSFVMQRWESSAGGFWDLQKWFVADMNGDGLPDLVNIFADNGMASIDVHINSGSSLSLQRWETRGGGFWDAQRWYVADMNGDGLPDLVNIFGSNNQAHVDVHVNKGASLQIQSWESPAGGYWDAQKWFVADMNGDGLPDLVNIFTDNGMASVDVHINSGSSLSLQRWETRGGGFWDAQRWYVADMNGDGLPDLVNIFGGNNQAYVDVHINKGASLQIQSWESPAGGYWDAQKWYVADMNGDGLPDLVNVFGDTNMASVDVHINSGTSLKIQRWETRSGGFWDSQQWFTFDANGDGATDLVNLFGGSTSLANIDVHVSNVAGPEITSIDSGLGAVQNITYTTSAKQFQKRYIRDYAVKFPIVNSSATPKVVMDVQFSNGLGSSNTTSYSYANLLFDTGRSSRGSLGFQWTQTKDASTGLVSRTCYRQDWPYIGMVDKAMTATSEAGLPACNAVTSLSPLTTPGSNLLSLSVNSYKFQSYAPSDTGYATPTVCQDDPLTGKTSATCPAGATAAGQRYQIYGFQSLTQSRDWDGSTFIALPASRTSVKQDNWGNVTEVKAETLNPDGQTASGYSKTTTNTYMPVDTTNWLLGRLQKSQVQAVSP